MQKNYMLAIDAGTSACKVAVFDKAGTIIASQTKDYPVYYPAPGYVEQKPNEWWVASCEAIKDIFSSGTVEPKDIQAVGVDGQSWSCIPVDKSGNVLFNNPIWMDTRAAKICEDIKVKIGESEIFKISGNPFEPMYTTPKILWFRQEYPDVFARTYKVLQSNSYFVYKLTGKFSQDTSQGYGLHFYNAYTNNWDIKLAEEFNIPLDLMCDIYMSHEVVGSVSEEASKATGLLTGTPVVAGGLDAACSTFGGGVAQPGQTQEQGGQAGGMSICLDSCLTHKKLIMSTHVVPNRWLLQGGTVGGGGTLKWLRETLLSSLKFSEMSDLASESPPGSNGVIFLPYMSGERSPIWDENAKGVYFGLDYAKSKSDIIRATMEGVAFALLHNIKTAEEADAYIINMNSVGGCANSTVWMQIKSDVTGKPMCVPSSDTATTLGAAMLAGMGVGIYKDYRDAVDSTTIIKATYEPNMKNHDKYQKFYDVYLELYEQLKNSMMKINELVSTT